MSKMWVEVVGKGAKRRLELVGGLTRIAAREADIEVGGVGADELHLWCDPPKLIHVGNDSTPLCNGRAFQEVSLNDGDSVQWGDSVLVFGIEDDVLVELAEEAPAAALARSTAGPARRSAPGAAAAPSPSAPRAEPSGVQATLGERAWRRVSAGMLVELGLAQKVESKRWQQAVMRGEFDADTCARELHASSGIELDDPRLLERAGRLERDLLMMPLQTGVRSAGRRARRAARGGLAYVVAQFVAIGVYTLILLAIVLLVRVKYDYSLDEMLDSWLRAITP